MKRYFSLCAALVAAIRIVLAFPVTVPNVGSGQLKVCGQNMRNYFVVNIDPSRTGYSTVTGLETKTNKIVTAFRELDADIYAMCELENNDSVMHYLTNAMNEAAGQEIYAYVKDDNVYSSSEMVKSGFMYRKDKVKPYGSNISATSSYYYRYTMRIQGFEEIATGERFVLSMNHFKAKDSTTDQGEAKREANASDLVTALKRISSDPDILIMGDLNCGIDESPLQTIVDQGYVEQLLREDSTAYSYIYSNEQQLIDHVFANESMQEQITGAGVCHINTGTSKNGSYWYSDHDPYLVGMTLSSSATPTPDTDTDSDECTPITAPQDFTSGLGDFTPWTVSGSGASWYSNKYGACCNGYNKKATESWLISRAFDLKDMSSATISFQHNIYKNNGNGDYTTKQTLWYSTDYTNVDDPREATWHQLTIPKYSVATWSQCDVELPAEALTDDLRFAFKYMSNDSTGNFWEISYAALNSICKTTALEEVVEPIDLFDEDTRVFTILGQEVTARKETLPVGTYILVNAGKREKVWIRE